MVARSKEFKKTELISRIKKIAYEFKEYIDLINSINVFPITDKDTGSNIYLTLKSFSERSSFQGVGNSGNILEIFGNEFLNKLPDSFEISDIKRAVEKAIAKLEESILELKEGTIYTAIKKLKVCLEQGKNTEETLNELYKVVTESKKFIKQYTSQEVVDSGALGFLIILWLLNDKKPNLDFESLRKPILNNNEAVFCINVICDSFDEEKLKTFDSVIINRLKTGYKLHFHTADLRNLLDLKSHEIIKIIPTPLADVSKSICYITNDDKEKDFFNSVGLKTIFTLTELIKKTNPLETLYIIKDEQKNILEKIELKNIIIKHIAEVFIIDYIVSLEGEINLKKILKEMKKYSFSEKTSSFDNVIIKLSKARKEDYIHIPFLKENEIIIMKNS